MKNNPKLRKKIKKFKKTEKITDEAKNLKKRK